MTNGVGNVKSLLSYIYLNTEKYKIWFEFLLTNIFHCWWKLSPGRHINSKCLWNNLANKNYLFQFILPSNMQYVCFCYHQRDEIMGSRMKLQIEQTNARRIFQDDIQSHLNGDNQKRLSCYYNILGTAKLSCAACDFKFYDLFRKRLRAWMPHLFNPC